MILQKAFHLLKSKGSYLGKVIGMSSYLHEYDYDLLWMIHCDWEASGHQWVYILGDHAARITWPQPQFSLQNWTF